MTAECVSLGSVGHVPRVYQPGINAPGIIELRGDPARHLAGVLRVRPGDPVLLFAGDGREWQSTVCAARKDVVQVEVRQLAREEPPPAPTLELWIGLVRAQRFDLAVEKCTEAGADLIRPLISTHAARGEATSAARLDRWKRIAVEAAEQSNRLFVPAIADPAPFEALRASGSGAVLVADGSGRPWTEIAPIVSHASAVAIAVGPEGGWSPAELAAARERGALITHFGPTTLRTETAAIVAAALVRTTLPGR